MQPDDKWLLGWLAAASLVNFLLFGYDKLRAGTSSSRLPESWLVLIGALGGWAGGLVAMLVFRHKTAKLSFQLKYAAALIIQLGLLFACLRFR
jgi:uncharacterized membrane protein YsdA (DUF1294 family)